MIVGFHGYGSDERQLETLVPLDLSTVFVYPRAGHRVEPGWGWWLPTTDDRTNVTELAPTPGVDAAVAQARRHVRDAQQAEGFGPDQTAVVGYSQGATLALTLVARHPELMAAAVTGAGFLLPNDGVVPTDRPVEVLVMNGSLDPVITADDHRDTVDRLAAAGHAVADRRDPIPHVIDRSQVADANRHLRRSLKLGQWRNLSEWRNGVEP